MCGFLYTGADLGGFGADTTRELLLRFLALGVFTPLMRNHSATWLCGVNILGIPILQPVGITGILLLVLRLVFQ